MKKILIILGTITLIGTSTTSLVACNTTQYTKKELTDLKEKNNIITKDGILEWIAPQEKPFNKIDNKYYFIVWHINKNNDWKIVKFKQYDLQNKVLDNYNKYNLKIHQGDSGLIIYENKFPYRVWGWQLDTTGHHFKSVYRWDGDRDPNSDIQNKLKSYLDL